MDNLHALMRKLKDGSFEPLPLRRVYIEGNCSAEAAFTHFCAPT